MANRYWLPMLCTIFVVVLGSFIRSAQTLECYYCSGESCNKLSKDAPTVNCTSLNSNPLNPGNITPNTNGTNTNGNGTNTNTNGTNTNGNGTNTNTNGTHTNGNSTHTNSTNTTGNKTVFEFAQYDDDYDTMKGGEEIIAAASLYAEPTYRCLKVVTSDKNKALRRCALANVTDACHTYTGLNASQATCYLCDKDKCNGAYVPRAAAAFALIPSFLLFFYLG